MAGSKIKNGYIAGAFCLAVLLLAIGIGVPLYRALFNTASIKFTGIITQSDPVKGSPSKPGRTLQRLTITNEKTGKPRVVFLCLNKCTPSEHARFTADDIAVGARVQVQAFRNGK